jgi:hypothetical protein
MAFHKVCMIYLPLDTHTPFETAWFTPELQWQSRGNMACPGIPVDIRVDPLGMMAYLILSREVPLPVRVHNVYVYMWRA